MEIIGIVLFALGILISIALHEAGHMWSARAFGMKVTRFFIGFGPTVWSFRRKGIEYGIKPIPFGAFVKIVGMTPQDDDVEPGDEHRAMWRYPVWKRTIVMSAGSAAHFMLGIVILWGLFAFAPRPDWDNLDSAQPVVNEVYDCVQIEWEVDPATGRPAQCTPGSDPRSAALTAGLRQGDQITAVGDTPVTTWASTTEAIRAAGGETLTITYIRDGETITTAPVAIPSAERPKQDVDPATPVTEITPAQLERVGQLGITPVPPKITDGPVAAVGTATNQTVDMVEGTFAALKKFPEKVPKLWAALTGSERDPETPISVVGASRIGGELFERGEVPTFLLVLAGLNFFVGIFNLFPLLPLDGGHIAIAWFEKIRSWIYARLGRADPGRVDYYKLMPITYAVILIFGGFTLLTVAADIVNPVTLFK